jgi:hypothetical protein
MAAPAPVYRGQANELFRTDRLNRAYARGQAVPYDVNGAPTGATVSWGGITGSLSAQTDLVSALLAKASLTGAAFSGAISATNLSGTNTGDQFTSTTASRLLGRGASGSGAAQEITLGTNLSMSGTTLNATGGGSGYSVVMKTAGYTETATSGELIIKADLAAGFTIVLPTAVGNTAKIHVKKMQAAGSIVVDGAGSETIDGGLTATLTSQYETLTLVSDNANWLVI